MSRRVFRFLIAFSIGFSVLIRFLVFPGPNYGATHDDELMVRLASNILKGNWLGNYSDFGHLILSKPAGYPLFLARTHFLPWAPTTTVHLILISGILFTAVEMRRLNVGRFAVVVFVILSAFNPQWFGSEMSRIYRDGFLTALTFVGIGLSLRLGRLIKRPGITGSSFKSVANLLLTACFLGICLSWSIATKPSWYPLAIIAVVISLQSFPGNRDAWRTWWRRALIASIAFVLGLVSIVGYVMWQNKIHYDVFELDSFSYGSYPSALSAWTSTETKKPRPHVLVDVFQRESVYKISEIARSLREHLELSWGYGWRGQSCSSQLHICDESSTWFVWDLRDAMHLAGHDSNAVNFEKSFARLRKDIADACSDGRLNCGQSGIAPGVLPVNRLSKREVLDALSTAVDWVVFPDVGSTIRGGVPSESASLHLSDWDRAIRGLPPRQAVSEYRPEVSAIGNTILLIQRLYGVIWPLTILLTVVGLLFSLARPNFRSNGLIVIAATVSVGVLILQLSILESSSGMYLTAGKRLYLLVAFPYVHLLSCFGIDALIEKTVGAVRGVIKRDLAT